MKTTLFTLLLSSFILSGCATPFSEAPMAINFANSEQHKLQAGAHWESIANHLSKTVLEQMGNKKIVYINEPSEKSKFNMALHNLVLSSLIKEGVTVAKFSAASDVSIDLKTQVIKFSKDRATGRNSVGVPTLLTAGVWALTGVASANTARTTLGVSASTIAVGLDAYNWFGSHYATGEIPQHEIIVSINVTDNAQYLSSISNIYYIADSDTSLYKGTSGRKISIEGNKE